MTHWSVITDSVYIKSTFSCYISICFGFAISLVIFPFNVIILKVVAYDHKITKIFNMFLDNH